MRGTRGKVPARRTPLSVEERIVRAAVAWEMACRNIIHGRRSRATVAAHSRAFTRLSRAVSLLVGR